MMDQFPDFPRERSYPTPLQNSTLLPLLLFSLATQRIAPKTKSVFEKEYDYVIVGAGSAGSVIASRLSDEKCVSVLLLEAGKSPPLVSEVPSFAESLLSSDLNWKYESEPQKYSARIMIDRKIIVPSGKSVGGSSVLNGMLYLRGTGQNYDDWEAQGADGWNYDVTLPLFKKAEGNQDPDIARNGYHGTKGPLTVKRFPYEYKHSLPARRAQERLEYQFIDPNGPSQIGIADYQVTIRGGQRCSVAKAYLVPSENKRNLDIVSEAFVTKIIINKKKKARGVLFDYKGRQHKVKAKKEVILSAGTFRSAQLLMLSGIGPRRTLEKFGIKVKADLPVGQNYHDHPRSFLSFTSDGRIPPSSLEFNDASVLQYINSRTGIYSAFPSQFGISFLKSNPRDPSITVPDIQLVFSETVFPISAAGLGISESDYEKYYGPYKNRTNIFCNAFLPQPRSRGYLSIKSINPYDKPVFDPNFLQDSRDVKLLVKGLKKCRRIFKQRELRRQGFTEFATLVPGCERFAKNEDAYLACVATSLTNTGFLPVGTVKMGKKANNSTVVDPTLRVKGISGLRVADASVIPTIPTGTTNSPAIMIGEKASVMIGESFGDLSCP